MTARKTPVSPVVRFPAGPLSKCPRGLNPLTPTYARGRARFVRDPLFG